MYKDMTLTKFLLQEAGISKEEATQILCDSEESPNDFELPKACSLDHEECESCQ